MSKVAHRFAYSYLFLLAIGMLVVMLFYRQQIYEQNISQVLLPPSFAFPFGTDSLGRNLFVRVLSGGFISLSVGIVGTFFAAILGILIGGIAGYRGGIFDRIMMRFIDVIISIPGFVLVAVFTVLFTDFFKIENQLWSGLITISLSIGITHWMQIARLTRAKILDLKNRPFVEAAHALGAKPVHIFFRHLWPNMMGTVLILVAAQLPSNIIYESFLSFVGLGIQPPDTSWGVLIREGWKSLGNFPHLVFAPSLVLFGTIWSFHIVLSKNQQ